MSGESEGAILEGVEDDKEYQISLSALYGDGAQSEAVAIRYSTCESHTLIHRHRTVITVRNNTYNVPPTEDCRVLLSIVVYHITNLFC